MKKIIFNDKWQIGSGLVKQFDNMFALVGSYSSFGMTFLPKSLIGQTIHAESTYGQNFGVYKIVDVTQQMGDKHKNLPPYCDTFVFLAELITESPPVTGKDLLLKLQSLDEEELAFPLIMNNCRIDTLTLTSKYYQQITQMELTLKE